MHLETGLPRGVDVYTNFSPKMTIFSKTPKPGKKLYTLNPRTKNIFWKKVVIFGEMWI
jgi:hypothetical protein